MTTEAMSAPEPVTVRIWGEGHAEKMLSSIIRVLVAGQHAGAIRRTGDGWEAQVHGIREGWRRDASDPTRHDTAAGAVQAIQRSSWARKLGARAASPVYWSDRAKRLAGRAPRKAER